MAHTYIHTYYMHNIVAKLIIRWNKSREELKEQRQHPYSANDSSASIQQINLMMFVLVGWRIVSTAEFCHNCYFILSLSPTSLSPLCEIRSISLVRILYVVCHIHRHTKTWWTSSYYKSFRFDAMDCVLWVWVPDVRMRTQSEQTNERAKKEESVFTCIEYIFLLWHCLICSGNFVTQIPQCDIPSNLNKSATEIKLLKLNH